MIGTLIYALFGITQTHYGSRMASLLRNERFFFYIYKQRKRHGDRNAN
jgi:hypothetical protein